jgi:hypothetical protein
MFVWNYNNPKQDKKKIVYKAISQPIQYQIIKSKKKFNYY